ncbi:MAG: nitrilase, partial [Burkholderiaceae bacterium]
MDTRRLTAAVTQSASVLLDTPATVERALALMAEAARQGVQLLVFSEAYLGGYPKGADFHIYIGARTAQGRAEYELYFNAAITVDGPEIAQLAKAAAQHGMYVVVGIIERDGGTLYCTAVYLGPQGQVLGKHRKLMPTGLERLV